MFWNQSKAVNRAAKTIRSFLSEHKMELTQAQALDLVARLQGFPNHMAANAALEKKPKEDEVALRSWEDLWQFIATMNDEQRKASITVSEGCDENGNAEFFDANCIVKATASCIDAAADGVLESFDHVLLFNNDSMAQDYPVTELIDKATRYAYQCELLEVMDFEKAKQTYLFSPLGALNSVPSVMVGDWVIFHQSSGYYNNDFGFVGDRDSATGWETEQEALSFMKNHCAAYSYAKEDDKREFLVLHCPGKSDLYPTM